MDDIAGARHSASQIWTVGTVAVPGSCCFRAPKRTCQHLAWSQATKYLARDLFTTATDHASVLAASQFYVFIPILFGI